MNASLRQTPPSKPPFRRGPLVRDGLLAALLSLVVLIYAHIYKPGGADEAYYLGQLSSLLEDGDLDLRNDHLWMVNDAAMTLLLLTRVQGSGRLDNLFSIGPALFWAPAYAAGRAWVRAGMTDDLRRWGRPHVVAMHLMSLAVLAAAMILLRNLLRVSGLPATISLIGAFSLLLGSPLFFYGLFGYGGSHLPGLLASALYVATLLRFHHDPQPARAFTTGLALGLLTLIRWQDALFGILMLLVLAERLGPANSPKWIKSLAAFGAGVLTFVSLQMHVWLRERGSLLTIPQGGEFMQWTEPRLLEFLFAGYRGLFLWAPVYALGMLGLLLPWRVRLPRSLARGALAVLVAEIYVNACVWDWWAGASYGQRRMTSCLPLVAVGLANLLARLPRRATFALCGVLMGWGIVTLHLHQSFAQDLTLLVLGRPSATGAKRDQIHINSPEHAWNMMAHWQPGPSEANYFEYDFIGGSVGGRAATLVLAALGVAATVGILHVWRSKALAATLVFMVLMSLILHVRVGMKGRDDDADPMEWKRISIMMRAGDYPGALQAIETFRHRMNQQADAGSPADACRYLEMVALMRLNRYSEARLIFEELKEKNYQSLELLSLP